MKKILLIISMLCFSISAIASTAGEISASQYLSTIQNDSQKLRSFLKDMPKGGDLHNHTSGSTFAEKMLDYAKADNLCVSRKTFSVSAKSKCRTENLLNNAIKDLSFRDALIDTWSMQHFQKGSESGHDHFFKTFGKFSAISHHHLGEILAEITERAAEQNELYIETMLDMDSHAAGNLAKKLGWDPDFNKMRNKLLAANFDEVVAGMTTYLDNAEAKMRTVLNCDSTHPKPGCQVKIRYQQQVARLQPSVVVFAELLAGFEAAAGKDKRIVSLNLVQPEDAATSMKNYKLHMKMVGFLHKLYPNVKVTLHAGELNSDVASPKGLSFHINDAVKVAHASRIGHGVDIVNENSYQQLLKDMAKQNVMVEINLSSNSEILNIEGKNHPLPLYLQYGVPVALSTDDEGVTRDIMTTEYVKAVHTYKIDYLTLKNMVRNSISYAFLPGESLWQNSKYLQPVTACKKDTLGSDHSSTRCTAFLAGSEKAQLQWELEKRFTRFEDQYV